MMEITQIHNNEQTPLMNDDENHKPSEKSVETNASTSSVPMDDDQLPLLFGQRQQQQRQQRLEKRGRDVLPTGYEIRIDAATAVADGCCDDNVRDGKGGGDVTKVKQQLDVSFDVLNDEDKVVTALDQLDISDKPNVHNDSGGSMTISREKQSSPQSSSPVLSAIVNNTTETDFFEEDDLEYEWTPPRHIYALRKIVVDYHTMDGGFCGKKDEVYHDSCDIGGSSNGVNNNNLSPSPQAIPTTSLQHPPPSTPRPESPPDTLHHPIKQQRKSHIISSQMVNISGYENTKLEEISKGSVLCSHWIDDENEEEEQWSNKVRSAPKVCTTKCDTEEIITIVPNTLARRRMGCNCVEGCEVLEDGDDDDDVKNKKKKSRRVYNSWRTIKRIVFCQLKRRGSNHSNEKSHQEGDDYCPKCNVFGPYHVDKPLRKEKRVKKRRNRSSLTIRNVGEAIYGDESVLSNSAEPVNDILSIDSSLGIYICESGLTAAKCQEIIDAAECLAQHKGAWSAYTYAKQTLGCKEYDDLAEASGEPVMTACATVVDRLNEIWEASGNTDESDDGDKRQSKVGVSKSGNDVKKKKRLVLDVREPHVVKYDLSRMERRKLDMHTDRSVWTFIIALSEGRGQDYSGGGTFFEKLNATVHLQRGQMIIFRGKLRHRGVKITYGKRYLLVGFLVEQKPSALNRE